MLVILLTVIPVGIALRIGRDIGLCVMFFDSLCLIPNNYAAMHCLCVIILPVFRFTRCFERCVRRGNTQNTASKYAMLAQTLRDEFWPFLFISIDPFMACLQFEAF